MLHALQHILSRALAFLVAHVPWLIVPIWVASVLINFVMLADDQHWDRWRTISDRSAARGVLWILFPPMLRILALDSLGHELGVWLLHLLH